MSMEAVLKTYFIESHELLEQMESLLLHFENGDVADETESLNAIFRAAHTIKGSAGIFSLDAIVAFTHVVENVLDKLRSGSLTLDKELISLLLHCRDHIAALIVIEEMAVSNERNTDERDETYLDIQPRSDALIQALGEYLEAEDIPPQDKPPADQSMAPFKNPWASPADSSGRVERMEAQVENDYWHISLRFGQNSYRDGMDPLSFLHFLGGLGEVVDIITLTESLPSLDNFDPETCYLGFEIQFNTNASKQDIEDAFEFMREDGFLQILPPHSALGDYMALIETLPEVEMRLGEILIECGALTPAELDAALLLQSQSYPHDKRLGEILHEQDSRIDPVLQAALQKQSQTRDNVIRGQTTLRVDADKLDILINRVGEMVTAGAGTVMQAEALGNTQMTASVSLLNELLEEVRDAALKLRMVPIGDTFGKFQRVVRDTASELEKAVELQITGGDTELDKSVVEKIGDPLMHLVRNALDHGIETPEERQEKGKARQGRLSLNAYHDSGNIVIEVGDDGKGLDPDQLRRKAIEKGLIGEAEILSQEELFNLIFEPGFSTAATVSNLSGRGVGMDVVKRNITDLRGRVEVSSVPGAGTTVRITLPLTLAIIDGFLIGVGEDAFVVPLDLIQECVELDEKYLKQDNSNPYINLRGEVLPLINLRHHFTLGGKTPRRQSVVVVKANGQQSGLVVDRLMGEFQTVIKPLGRVFERVDGLSGSTILGSGSVALILDVQGLIRGMAAHSVQPKGYSQINSRELNMR